MARTWRRESGVIGTHDLDLANVALDDGLVVADRLDEEQLEAFLADDLLVKFPAPLLRRVGCVEDGHFAFLVLQVVEDVVESFLADLEIEQDLNPVSRQINLSMDCFTIASCII